MAGNIGFYQRKTRKLNVNTGSRLTDVSKLTRSLPNADGVAYWSGEALWAVPGGSIKLVPGADGPNFAPTAANVDQGTFAISNYQAGAKLVDADWRWTTVPQSATPCCFAFQDSDEWDGSGKNMAFSTLDKFEIQTPFYDTSKAYTEGMPLTVKLVAASKIEGGLPAGNTPRAFAGQVNTATSGEAVMENAYALVCPAGDNDEVFGYVTDGVVSVDGNANPPSVVNDKVVGGPAVWTESSLTKTVLQFQTAYQAKLNK